MEIGCNLSSFRRYGEKRYLKMKEIGFNYVDIGVRGLKEGETQDELDAFYVQEKALADAAGVQVYQVHAPFIFPPQDRTPEQREERFVTLVQSMRAALLLGAENWVVHPMLPYYGMEDELYLAESHKINVDFFRRLLPKAKEMGLTICFENTASSKTRFVTPEETLSIIKEIDDESLRMCLDTGHCVHMGAWSAGEAVRQAGSYLHAFHIHDSTGYHHDDHLFPFFGRVDWHDFYLALGEVGYDGVLCLETGPSPKLSDKAFEAALKAMYLIANDILR